MAVDVQNSNRKTAPDPVSMTASANEAQSIVRAGKTKQRAVAGSSSGSSDKAGKQPENVRTTVVKLKESDNRFTSPELIRAIEDSFGKIDFDPCWHEASAVRPKRYFDVRKGDNGLTDAWHGQFVFVNPPWSAAKKWVERAYHQWLTGKAKTVVCLVPAKTDTKFFHNDLARDADVYFLEGRPRFFKEDRTSEGTMVSVMVVMFGTTSEQRVRFAELVPGSWWLPRQASSVRTEEAGVGWLSVNQNYSQISCAASHPRGGVHPTVLCTPFVRPTVCGLSGGEHER